MRTVERTEQPSTSRRDDRYFLRRADYVCHDSIVRQRFRIVNTKVINKLVLRRFFGLSPACLSSFPGATPSLFIGHGFESALAADPTALRSHFAHDLLND